MFKDKFLPEIRKPGTMNDKPQFSSTKRPEQKEKSFKFRIKYSQEKINGKIKSGKWKTTELTEKS